MVGLPDVGELADTRCGRGLCVREVEGGTALRERLCCDHALELLGSTSVAAVDKLRVCVDSRNKVDS